MSIHCIDISPTKWDDENMPQAAKTSQLQIRVTHAQKLAIQRAADAAGMDMSSYVLGRALSADGIRFAELIEACSSSRTSSFALAELNAFLTRLTPLEFRAAIELAPLVKLTPYLSNYVAAMVEYGCARCRIPAPAWTRDILPLSEPVFGTALLSLRLHLLTHSPAPFRNRNIYIDATLGDQV